MRNLLMIGWVLGILISGTVQGAEGTDIPRSISRRIAVLTTLPGGVVYVDQGFGSRIKNVVEVEKQAPDFEALLTHAAKEKFVNDGIPNVTFVPLPDQIRIELTKAFASRGFFQSTGDFIRPFLKEIRSTQKVDTLVLAARGFADGETVPGVGIVTKLGALGITNLTRVYASIWLSVWDTDTLQYVVASNSVTRQRQFPAIYRDWSVEMVEGPNFRVRLEMDRVISDLVREAIAEAFRDISNSRLDAYFRGARKPEDRSIGASQFDSP